MATTLLVPTAILASTNLGGTVADIDDVIDLGSGALFEEPWTGSDSDPWPSARWETAEEGHASSTLDIQGNAGQVSPAGANYTWTRIESKSGTIDDFDLTVQFTLAGTSEQYHLVAFRHGGDWFNNRPNNAYWLEISMYASTFYMALVKTVANTRTDIAVPSKAWNTSLWNLRIQAIGSAIKVKAWQGTEPGTWDIEETDTALASGIITFESFNGNSTAAKPITYDNLVVMPA